MRAYEACKALDTARGKASYLADTLGHHGGPGDHPTVTVTVTALTEVHEKCGRRVGGGGAFGAVAETLHRVSFSPAWIQGGEDVSQTARRHPLRHCDRAVRPWHANELFVKNSPTVISGRRWRRGMGHCTHLDTMDTVPPTAPPGHPSRTVPCTVSEGTEPQRRRWR